MTSLAMRDLSLNMKVKLDVRSDKPYVMNAIVWRLQENVVTFKDSRKQLFVFMTPERLQSDNVSVTLRK